MTRTRWCLLLQLCWLPLLWNQYWVGQFNDDASYLALARSLAHGLPYQDLFEVGAPADSRFPPGYPLLLAPLQAFFPHQFWLARLQSLAFSLAALWFFCQTSRSKIAPWLVAANPFWALCGTMVMSESLFTLLTLVYLERLERPANRKQLFILGLAAALCYYVRAVGLALVPTTLLCNRRRPWSDHACFLLGFWLAAGPHLLGTVFSGYGGEFSGWDPLLNLQTIPVHYGAVLLGLPALELSPLYALLFLAALVGLARKPELSLAASWTVCYLLVMVCWPFAEARFAIPILPSLVLGLCAWLPRPLLGLVLVAQVASGLTQAQPAPDPGPETRSLVALIPPGTEVASSRMWLGVYADVPSYAQAASDIDDQEWDWDQNLLDHNIGLVVLSEAELDLIPRFQARPAGYRQVAPKAFAFTPNRRAILLHSAARQALQEKRYASAEWLFREALLRAPRQATLWSGLAVALFRLERPQEAAGAARGALQRDAQNREASSLIKLVGGF